ncbi:MAG: hypothetical protein HW421_838 [Ignavibacteria bacterium]|nr:hypothetical protein [Ignavibacteria bacterium]
MKSNDNCGYSMQKCVSLRLIAALIIFLVIFIIIELPLHSQNNAASPANWLYPQGNPEATRYVWKRSLKQSIDSMKVKWNNRAIRGDVQPLIGNIIDDSLMHKGYPFRPNEICAFVGDSLVVVDAYGKTKRPTLMPGFVKGVSCLIDTSKYTVDSNVTGNVLIGIESLEVENTKDTNRLAYAYIAGFDKPFDTLKLMQKLAINLEEFTPNLFASLKPVFGHKDGNDLIIYTVVNMSQPSATEPQPVNIPFFRGLTAFRIPEGIMSYPLPDLEDLSVSRVSVGPEVNYSQPSLTLQSDIDSKIALPCYSSPILDVEIKSAVQLDNVSFTRADGNYLMEFNISIPEITNSVYTDLYDVPDAESVRPLFRPYYFRMYNPFTLDSSLILLAEEFGIDSSEGYSRLHIYNITGGAQTNTNTDPSSLPFIGGKNHMWSIAAGDVDGDITTNPGTGSFPNNNGIEIIASQSSREFAYAAGRLMALRYTDAITGKPSPPNTYLHYLDTIATQKINGWVAAVNDLDGDVKHKDEIVLVDGSTVKVLQMRDYNDENFQKGRPFKTLYSHNFLNETISSVEVADLEGDGYNDIIVTTFDSTYVIGKMLPNMITFLSYSSATAPIVNCIGDTLYFKWENFVSGNDNVDLLFYSFDSGTFSSTITQIANIPNVKDTVEYKYVVGTEVMGKEGIFVIRSTSRPNDIYSYSTTFQFEIPNLTIDSLPKNSYEVGEKITFNGTVSCMDSISVQYSTDGTFWNVLASDTLKSSGTFSISSLIPCLQIFGCDIAFSDTSLFARIIYFRTNFQDTSKAINFRIKPARFIFILDTNNTINPAKRFTWKPIDITFPCDTVSLSISTSNGATFSQMDRVPVGDGLILWSLPEGIPDSLMVRLCCENSCVRIDTLISSVRAKYINAVAPNPFSPAKNQTMEIVYTVPAETNVSFRIYDQNNKLVAEPVISQSRLPGIIYTDSWNGLIPSGSFAANGLYYLSMELSNGEREIYPIFVRK